VQALLGHLPIARVYLDNILVLTEISFQDKIHDLEQVFIRLRSSGLRCNALKCNLAAHETEYLGFKLTKAGIQP
jgi:hypothetical protein